MNEGDGLAAMVARFGIDRSREQNAVASGEALFHRGVASKACGSFRERRLSAGLEDAFGGGHRNPGIVAASFDSEVVVGLLRKARFAPRAFGRGLRHGDTGGQSRAGRALLRGRGSKRDELLVSHKLASGR